MTSKSNQSGPSKSSDYPTEESSLDRKDLVKNSFDAREFVIEGTKTTRAAVRRIVRNTVIETNWALSKINEATDSASHQFSSSLSAGAVFFTQIRRLYERRHEYGPQIVGGGTVLTGGLVALRRRRIVPGALSGVLTGGILYVAVYEPYLIERIPDYVFGKRNT